MITLEHFDPAMLLTSNQRLHWAKKGAATAYWRGLGNRAGVRVAPVQRARVVFWMRFPTNHRRDANNWWPTAKACIDGMVDAGTFPDDDSRHVIGPDMRIEDERGPHRIRIEIEELS